MSSVNEDNIMAPICTPAISFSCLITLASISSTMLKSSGERGHPLLIFYLCGKASSFFVICILLAEYLFKRYSLSNWGSSTLLLAYLKHLSYIIVGFFVKYFFYINWYNHFFSFTFCVLDYINCLSDNELALHSHLVMTCNYF